jgi:Holliday junction resolvase RusA-like endonuclease
MRSTRVSISGVPYAHQKSRGDIAAPARWTEAVKKQTVHLPKVVHPCVVRITFRLPPDKFPKDHPYGSDLDNLLKRFFDALIDTVFSDAPGKDGIVISIEATKVKVGSVNESGADLEIIEIEKSHNQSG